MGELVELKERERGKCSIEQILSANKVFESCPKGEGKTHRKSR